MTRMTPCLSSLTQVPAFVSLGYLKYACIIKLDLFGRPVIKRVSSKVILDSKRNLRIFELYNQR